MKKSSVKFKPMGIKMAALMMFSGTFVFAQQSFSIDESLQYSVDNNIQVKKAKIDQDIAAQRVKETTGIGLPQINAQGTYNYFMNIPVQLLPAELAGGEPGTFIPVQFGQKQSASAGVTLSQLLFNGSYLVGLQASKAYRETAALAEEKTKISIKEGITLAYAAVIVTDENLKTLEENKKLAEKVLHDTRETYRVGLIEEQNVEQLEYSFKNLKVNIENLKRTRKKLAMTLKYLMGYPLDESISLTTTLDEMVANNNVLLDESENLNFDQHIDLRLRENAVKISELQLKLEKSRYLPSLSGFVSTQYNGYGNNFDFFKSEQQWFNTSIAGLQLDVPVFSGFQRHWRKEQAKLQVQKTQLDLNDTQRTLKANYFSSAVDYNNAVDSYTTAKDLIQLSSNIYRKEQIKFKEGLGNSFDLQNSENQLYNSQAKLYDATLNLIRTKIALDVAAGKL